MTIETFHWNDWTLDALMSARHDTTVSLVVPARNEAATVGDVVSRVRERLVDTVALLDEIVVIDSDSTDATYDVATDAGAVVHRSAEIRPDLGTRAHRHQALRDLSGMATQILAAALARVGAGPEVDERAPAVTLR